MADTITIGQAASNLDKKAGDSSGKEVCKINFKYIDSITSPYNWTYVFRPKDSTKAEKAAIMCEKAIANNNIGYSKSGETEYGKDKAMTKLAKAVNYDLSKITTKCGLSCGDLICLCNHYAELSTCYIGSALELTQSLKNNSNFNCLPYTKGMILKRGDTIITAHANGKNNHVAMVLNGGNNMATKTRVQIARDVIAGDYGSGDARIAALKKEGYNPVQVQEDVNTLLCCRENIINNMKAMANRIAANNNWWYIYWQEQYGHECAICHPHGGANHGWQCIGFVIACWHHAGLPIPCNCGVIDNGTGERILKAKTDAEALKIAQNALKLKDIKVIRNNGKVIPKSQVQPGDIMALFTDYEFQHLVLAMSQTKVADSTHGATKADDIRADRNFSGRYESRLKLLIRYTGNGLCPPPKRTIDELAYEVIDGLWGGGDSRKIALTQAGHNYDAVQKRVNEILNPSKPKKTIDELAKEVLDGKWGSGDERKKKLVAAGYDYDAVQAKVNELLKPKKSIDELAKEVLAGQWGSGDARKKNLEAAGYNYDQVQKKVNELLAQQQVSYSGTLPSLTIKKSNTEVIEDTIKWALWIAGDNNFHYGYTSADKKANAHHNGCYFCGTQRMKKNMLMPEHTYCCNPFVGAAWAHGGCVPAALKLCQNTNSWNFSKGSGYDKSSLFDNLGHPAKSKLKKGDVLCRDTHVALYIGDGKIVQAGGGDDNKKNSARWNKSISVSILTDANYKNFPRVHRFNGSVNTTMNIRHGEVSKRVAQWQAFLDWYFDGKVGKADGYYGDNTLKWTKQFQEEVIGKGEGDGIIGPKTIEAAKKVKK